MVSIKEKFVELRTFGKRGSTVPDASLASMCLPDSRSRESLYLSAHKRKLFLSISFLRNLRDRLVGDVPRRNADSRNETLRAPFLRPLFRAVLPNKNQITISQGKKKKEKRCRRCAARVTVASRAVRAIKFEEKGLSVVSAHIYNCGVFRVK